MREVQGKRFLVTGGAGFIGSHLADKLLELGAEVSILDDFSTGKASNIDAIRGRPRVYEGSVDDAEAVKTASAGIDGVFHLAAKVSVPESVGDPVSYHRVNVVGALQILHQANRLNVRTVFSSSAAVYGNGLESPIDESRSPSPISPYGLQKFFGEEYVRYFSTAGKGGVSLRYFNVYGPRQDPGSPYSGVISIFLDRAEKNLPLRIYGDGKQTRDFVYVSDVVDANILAMLRDDVCGLALNIGTGSSVSLKAIASTVMKLFPESKSTVEHAEPRSGDIKVSCSNPSSAKRLLGWHPQVKIDQGLKMIQNALSS